MQVECSNEPKAQVQENMIGSKKDTQKALDVA
jgi:hypothetical protein